MSESLQIERLYEGYVVTDEKGRKYAKSDIGDVTDFVKYQFAGEPT